MLIVNFRIHYSFSKAGFVYGKHLAIIGFCVLIIISCFFCKFMFLQIFFFLSLKFTFMNIHVHLEDGIIEVIGKNNSSILVGPNISVRATAVGITAIYVSWYSASKVH